MSLSDDIWAALKKKEKKEKKTTVNTTKAGNKTTTKTPVKSSGTTKKSSSGNLSDDIWSALDDIAPVKSTPVSSNITSRLTSDIAPTKAKDDKWYDGWFQKGALEDGYDFGDITKVILGTTADIGQDLTQGAIGIVEKGIDFLTVNAGNITKAMYYQNGGGFNMGQA